MSRIRHATETFVNHLIEGVKQLISSNTEQINDLSTNKAGKTYVDEQDLKSMNYKALIDNTRLYMTTQTGIYLTPASGVTDLPEGWAQGRHTLVCFNPSNDLYGFQLITTYAGSAGLGGNRKFAIRHAMTEGSKWLELATTAKTDISFPYASNYNDIGTTDASTVTKVNNQVIVTMNTCKKDGESFTSGEIIGTLPVGYRPTGHTRSSGMSTNSVPILIEVFTNGNIRIKHTGATNITQITGEVIFYV